ncbi:MAG: response regulator [Planctomycetota bacterium]
MLVVEDGPDNRRLIKHHLAKAGAAVDECENGRCAIEFLGPDAGDARVDVVLMDMQMPEMDGYDATRWLRQHGHTMPIIALTANAMSGDEDRCLAAGCDAYQPKPFDPARVIAAVEQLLQRKQLGDAA